MRTALKEGKNPAPLIKEKLDVTAMTFKDYASELIEAKRSEWLNAKHAQQWENTLEQLAYPKLGAKLPADVTLADVKAVLMPIWTTKTETAVRLRGRIEQVLDMLRYMKILTDAIQLDGKAILIKSFLSLRKFLR